jgi:hypothetical protein
VTVAIVPKLKGIQFLWGMLGIISTLFCAIGFIGFFVSLSSWDIDSAAACGLFFSFFAFFACVMGRLMEK